MKSLKERMAALQGAGAFGGLGRGGGAPPPNIPAPGTGDKPKPRWKPPVAVPAPSEDESSTGASEPRVHSYREDHSTAATEDEEGSITTHTGATGEESTEGGAAEGAEGSEDPEEDERRRRAAIAARMARLGGARFGMAPPVFAPRNTKTSAHQGTFTHSISFPILLCFFFFFKV